MIVASAVFVTALVLLFFLLYYLYRSIFYSPKSERKTEPYSGLDSPFLEGRRELVREQIDALSAHPCEKINIKSHDGLTLFARFYLGDEHRPVAILFHGYKGSSYTEPSGVAKLLLSRGIGALVVDHRAHGESDGKTISFGINERLDCKGWCEYIKGRFGEEKKIILFGISMGAATVLMASELALPSGVVGIIADCPYSSPSAILKRVLGNRGLPVPLVYPLVCLSALLFGRFKLGAASPTEAVKNARAPILLIHGEADSFVPPSMSEEILATCTSKKALVLIKEAKHAGSFAADTEKYSEAVLEFIESKIK